MNKKRYVLASVAAAVVISIVEMLGHGYCISGLYVKTASLWRTVEAMNQIIWIGYLATLIVSFLLVYIYHRGYEGNSSGALEGLRFGIIVGLFVAIPMAAWTYVTMPVPAALALGWFFIALIKFTVAGLCIGLIYKQSV
jgi:hypothetical protein